ncbi:MAG TPA: hypothetical protein VE999_01855 [Gemmataceae bacterium]|nr:hypothetical protein [Gemmataceae bacterium]
MDCKTARLLLDFARPQARELEAEEAEALESHLDHCPDCHSQARSERVFDERLGKAMRQVEVPAGLRDQLLARLESARGDWYRQRFAHAARLCAAAALLLVVGWFGLYWVREHWVTPIDTQRVANAIANDATEDPKARTERQLKALGTETLLPIYFDYHLLACPPFLTELPGYPGRMVPSLLFVRNSRVARVYLIRENAIPEGTPHAIDGSSFKAELWGESGEPYRYLIIHDGDDLDWLRPPMPDRA